MRAVRRGYLRCTVAILLQTLPEQDAADFRAALDDSTIMSTAIAQVMKAHGHNIAYEPVQRHRRGACSCPAT
jgi:hypothetical protein